MKAIRLFVKLLLSTIIIFLVLVFYLSSYRTFDIRSQRQRMSKLEKYYENYQEISDTKFINFLLDDDIKLNEIQLLATHNSYKKRGSIIGKFFIGLGDSFRESKALNYQYKTLTEQFENGIRSVELDVRLRKDTFELTHVPLVDNSSTAVNLKLALEEIKLYSKNNPQHLPIIILVELKDDWLILDSKLKDFSTKSLLDLDNLITSTLSDVLYKPSHLLTNSQTLQEEIKTNGWPKLAGLLGKVLFVLHPGKYTKTYVELDELIKTQAMFPAVYAENIDESYAGFVINNNVAIEQINQLVSNNFIVRTRIDEHLQFSDERFQLAISSGAQILSSDFTIGRDDLDVKKVIYLKDTYTIIKNSFLRQ